MQIEIKNIKAINRITILWAFSEAALGGILHALKIPLTGLFIGSTAVVFISLIAYFSESKSEVLKVTLKVILVKFVVSPHSPLTAYFAVALQGMLGYLLFYYGFNKLSAIILGFLSLLLSSMQKIIILTIVFGVTLWESINIFIRFVFSQLGMINNSIQNVNFSFIVVGIYIGIHVIAGFIAGFYASTFPSKLIRSSNEWKIDREKIDSAILEIKKNKKKKRKWWKRPSSILLFTFSILLIFLSFFFNELNTNVAFKVIIMLVRSVVVIAVWYYFISPLLLKIVRKNLSEKKQQHAKEIEGIINFFPDIRSVIKLSWDKTKKVKGIKKLFKFADAVLFNFLFLDSK